MATERQIRANRENRRRWRGHTPDGLQRLRFAARCNQPWRRSTGPRTTAGKSRSRMNALKHGGRSAEAVAARKALADVLRRMRTPDPRIDG